MSKFITFITCLLLIISLFGIISNAQAKKKQHPKVDSTENKSSVKLPYLEVNLEKERVMKWCEIVEDEEKICSKNDQRTRVTILAKDLKENQKLKYTYIVSAGRIIEEGANVIWDFSNDVEPGKYTLRVIADGNKKIHLESETKTVFFNQCVKCGIFDCTCPHLEATSLNGLVKVGETLTFNADVRGGSQNLVSYNWYISRGIVIESQPTKWTNASDMIIEGQGTPNIKVKTTPNMAGETVTATVEIGGACPDCGRTSSASVYIEKP